MRPRPRESVIDPLEPRRLCADATSFVAKIDFAPASATPVDGYVLDAGAPFADRGNGLSFGWDADVSTHFRDRGNAHTDRLLDTVAHMQLLGDRTWELAVPDAGVYSVHIVSGDPLYTNGRYAIDAEHVAAIRGTPTSGNHFLEATLHVPVTDGRLTLGNAPESFNNRLAYVEVTYVGPAPDTAAPVAGVTWSDSGADAPIARVEAGAIQVDDKLYVVGGYIEDLGTNRRFDVLDLPTLTWSRLPDPPAGVPETHGAWATDGESFYIAGGQIGDSIPGVAMASVWRYDTRTGEWSSLPALPEARYAGAMTQFNGRLHFFGGDRPDRTTVTTDHWVLDLVNVDAGWVSKAPLPLGGDHIAAAVAGGRIYAVGGEHDHAGAVNDGATYIQHDYLFAYDPAADAWTRRADLPTGSSHCEATTLSINGRILALGGQIAEQHITNTVRLYDPATDTWTLLADDLPGRRKGGAAGVFGGVLYFAGGQDDPDNDHLISRTVWAGVVGGL